MRPLITLTTDFGTEDPFVGIMKGVILSIAPQAQLIDITHQIDPQDVRRAAQVVEAVHPWFPARTVHLVVVDPGVGSRRRAIAVRKGTQTFIGPDNGVLSPVIQPRSRVYELTRPKYFLKEISSTFHGRDIFAPAAAWAARGTALSKMGPRIQDPQRLQVPQPVFSRGVLKGEIIYIDRFGNLISNIPRDLLDSCFRGCDRLSIRIAGKKIPGPVSSYSQQASGKLGAIVNSWDRLEVFCREGNAARRLKCGVGRTVSVSPSA